MLLDFWLLGFWAFGRGMRRGRGGGMGCGKGGGIEDGDQEGGLVFEMNVSIFHLLESYR